MRPAGWRPPAGRPRWRWPERGMRVRRRSRRGPGELLRHPDFHAAARYPAQLELVHEAANEEDAAPAALEDVLGRERVGDAVRIEALALVPHADREAALLGVVRRDELHVHHLPLIVPVAVLDRVDHALADRHAHPVHRVLVEAETPAQMVTDQLDEVEHVEGAAELEPDDVGGRRCHAGGTGDGSGQVTETDNTALRNRSSHGTT